MQYNISAYHCTHLLIISRNKSSVPCQGSFKISLDTLLISERMFITLAAFICSEVLKSP